jgi:hypothetical protein
VLFHDWCDEVSEPASTLLARLAEVIEREAADGRSLAGGQA